MSATTLRDAIFSPGQEIKFTGGKLPPSALASAPAAHLTDKYKFISTTDVVKMMKGEGFEVASAATRRARAGAGAPQTGVHVLDFRHPDAPKIAGVVPRVLFMNSHDGSRRARAMVGAFRLVCSNGMVAGTLLESVAARHAGDAAADLVKRMSELSRNTLPMFRQIERWERKDISAAAQREYARLASVLRWGNAGTVAPEALLEVRREADASSNMWTVFNRVQEATTRLELPGVSANGRRIRTRALREAVVDVKYNSALWQLTEEFAGF